LEKDEIVRKIIKIIKSDKTKEEKKNKIEKLNLGYTELANRINGFLGIK